MVNVVPAAIAAAGVTNSSWANSRRYVAGRPLTLSSSMVRLPKSRLNDESAVVAFAVIVVVAAIEPAAGS